MVLGPILPALAGTVCVPQWTALTAPMSATTARASSVNRVSKDISRLMMVNEYLQDVSATRTVTVMMLSAIHLKTQTVTYAPDTIVLRVNVRAI